VYADSYWGSKPTFIFYKQNSQDALTTSLVWSGSGSKPLGSPLLLLEDRVTSSVRAISVAVDPWLGSLPT